MSKVIDNEINPFSTLAVRELEQNGIPLVNSIDSLVKKAIFATKGVISVTSA
jgi:hypothetical protein